LWPFEKLDVLRKAYWGGHCLYLGITKPSL